MPNKIAILGGTFNPPHIAHIQIIQCIHRLLNVNTVHVIPAIAWQKQNVVSAEHRLNMLQLACANLSYVHINTIEIDAQKPSYSIETLQKLQLLHPQDTLYFIIGYDQLLNLNTWHTWQELHHYAHIFVVQRSFLVNNIDHQTLAPDIALHIKKYAKQFTLSMWQPPNISSTHIRSLIKQHDWENAALYLHADVLNYIQLHQLYCTD
jgi:nicotinate-nucleotide adenylyltransferase